METLYAGRFIHSQSSEYRITYFSDVVLSKMAIGSDTAVYPLPGADFVLRIHWLGPQICIQDNGPCC
jgi:hypothetical protein